ncbi:MAG: hypothetical protein M3P40_10290 [Actinomycetota bacterium]|nr:hypothetical protein [Actinomycetota bacterium]
MPVLARPVTVLETALLRRSLGASSAQRERCDHCHRTPLIGERIHFYGARDAEQLVCELCRPRRDSAPIRSALMHSPEHERAVRVLRDAA